MNYLTVQDMLWLSLQLTKREQEFDFAQLEEATFLQYAYHDSKDLASQAAKFLSGFKKKSPFSTGNEACAFIGTLAFVQANGMALDIPDSKGAEWLTGVWADESITLSAIKAKLINSDVHTRLGVPDMHELCESLIEEYEQTLASLLKSAQPANS